MLQFPLLRVVGSSSNANISRRGFLRAAGAATALAAAMPSPMITAAEPAATRPPSESLVKLLYNSLTAAQKEQVCFGWSHVAEDLGLLRTRISANWHVTKPVIQSDFYTADQQKLIREIFLGLIQPEWVSRIDKQLKDDEGGFGKQSMAIFGTPASDKFEFILTGRHITLRCDGNSTEHVAFGGPIVYGHAASGFNEKPGHPNNIFWPQAVAANGIVKMLDGKQRAVAVIKTPPRENAIGFQGQKAPLPGIAVKDLSADQKAHAQAVLAKLIEPYRQSDRDRVAACLKAQGGLDDCHLAFYEEGQLTAGAYDIWRLEGPAFVWHFRGVPHVHTWVHVADDPSVPLNAGA
ncbi:MAG: DUF3500 domain-containing protein [Thermoguttaceae bacterium]|jgi:hypothetical protein